MGVTSSETENIISTGFRNDWLADVAAQYRDQIIAYWLQFIRAEDLPHYAAWSDEQARQTLLSTLDQLLHILRTGDLGQFERFVRSILMRRIREGFELVEFQRAILGFQASLMRVVNEVTDDSQQRLEALQTVSYLHDDVSLRIAEIYEDIQAQQQRRLLEEARGRHEIILLLRASRLLASSLDLGEVLTRLARLAVESMGSDYSAVLLPDETQERLHVRAYYAGTDLSHETVQGVYSFIEPAGIGIKAGITGRVFRTGRALLINDYEKFPGHIPGLTEISGPQSMLIVPMRVREKTIGVFMLGVLRTDAFTKSSLSLPMGLADQAAIAIENARLYERERNIAETLQRSFLPTELPPMDGFELAVRYQAALTEAQVGGDFYDVFPIDDNRIAILIADISGKGLNAATYTAMGKYVTRAYALEDPSPSVLLDKVNISFCKHSPVGLFLTMFYGILDFSNQTLVYGSAGHNPPIFYSKSSDYHTDLDITGPGLGVMPDARYSERLLEMGAGDILFLYTDGATDVRHGDEMLGEEGLEKFFRTYQNGSAEEIVQSIFQGVLNYCSGRLSDDVVMVVLKNRRDHVGFGRYSPSGGR